MRAERARSTVLTVGRWALALSLVASGRLGAQHPSGPIHYPPTRRGAQVDEVHGVRIADPYRWLEAITSPDVRSWVRAQNAVTDTFVAHAGKRERIRERVTQLSNYPKLEPPFFGGDRLFRYERAASANQPTLFVQEKPGAVERVLLDVNTLSADGSLAVGAEAASPDGRYLAYGVTAAGSDWQQVGVRDVRTGQDLADTLRGIKRSRVAWTKDARGFFYVRYDVDSAALASNPLAPDRGQRVLYHRVGERQAQDQLIYERRDHPDWLYTVTVSDDGQYAVIAAARGAERQNRIFFIDLDRPKHPNIGAPIVTLFDAADARFEFISSRGALFYLLTTRDAPRGRVVAVDINAPQPSRWSTVVRETYDALVGARRVGDRFVAHRLRDAHSVLELYGLDGSPRGEVQLPSVGTVTSLTGGPEGRDFYFGFTSYLVPPTIFRYDLETRTLLSYKDARVDDDLMKYETLQLFYTSGDGMRVPMFITSRRDLVRDGTHPTLLAVEGALASSLTPVFSPEVVAWLDMGGVYAVANVRGGGEYGRAWHEAGARARKQTSFDDVVAAAEFLIAQRYTRATALAIAGSGHGGLVAGAVMVQRPQLFGAALIDRGILDLVRFDKFSGGAAWTAEYGSPADAEELKRILAYSPLHNVRDGLRYPPTLISAGEHDDRVAPVHGYKFAAALQAAPASGGPVLLRVNALASGVWDDGVPAPQSIALSADRLAFLAVALGMPR